MKGCNTLTLCPAQMHEAIEFWLKNQVLRAEHAARVEVVGVDEVLEDDGAQHFAVYLREKELPVGKCIPVSQAPGEPIQQAFDRAIKEAAASGIDPMSTAVEKEYDLARAYYEDRQG